MHIRTKAGAPVWINVSILVARPNRTAGTLAIHLFRDVTATQELLTLIQERLAPPASDAGAAAPGVLTRRELELLRLMTLGLNTAAAAARFAREPGDDQEPRAKYLRQAWRPQPSGGGRVRQQAPARLRSRTA